MPQTGEGWNYIMAKFVYRMQSILNIKEAIIEQRIRVRKAEEAVERARQILQEYMIERKTHEQLREAAFEEFKKELAKEESKEVDELVSYTYGQRRR